MNARQRPASPGENAPAEQPSGSPLSLARLREAFAAMLGDQEAVSHSHPALQEEMSTEYGVRSTQRAVRSTRPAGRPSPRCEPDPWLPTQCEINPRSVVEAMLFVGRPDNRPISARELAAALRGVSPAEVDAAVVELRALYDRDDVPYTIESTGSGYRLALREEFARMRDKFYGRTRETRLSPAALEVLSVLAYHQPATAEQINQMRGAPSGAALSTLVRRRLVQLERSGEAGAAPRYSTTDRFLKLFGLESLASLPRSDELGAA